MPPEEATGGEAGAAPEVGAPPEADGGVDAAGPAGVPDEPRGVEGDTPPEVAAAAPLWAAGPKEVGTGAWAGPLGAAVVVGASASTWRLWRSVAARSATRALRTVRSASCQEAWAAEKAS